jgi:hypothetical protein
MGLPTIEVYIANEIRPPAIAVKTPPNKYLPFIFQKI